ncbi:response regulator transcription factor [Ornithinimicrobium humiphilum]|uniref:LuxR family two component transcriptional regulator n=1 Tax=Ornithinimicrobium humiphilum TaxID=125288 RepID=A0A543KJY1_9MICO|nr:response regulator transcription factor [Ornithinimicrobium humiphilum]TQM95378.1 LuxR family two component transcriptional regulator [Ornithinimicrobium humiphilum]
MSVRVLLVDDQPLLLQGFAMILSVEDDLEVVGQVTDGEKAAAAVARLQPDVVLMDVQMPVLDGIEATRRIVAGHPDVRVLILTTFDRDDYLFAALEAGASGFLLKNSDPDDLVDAVRAVAEGHALLAPEVTRRVIARMTRAGEAPAEHGPSPTDTVPLPDLTQREREMLELVARGLSNGEIAAQAYVTEATVKTHISNILAKLGVRDRVQAVIAAYEAGLVSPGG